MRRKFLSAQRHFARPVTLTEIPHQIVRGLLERIEVVAIGKRTDGLPSLRCHDWRSL